MSGQSVIIKSASNDSGVSKTAAVDQNGHLAIVSAQIALVGVGLLWDVDILVEQVSKDDWIEILIRTQSGVVPVMTMASASAGEARRDLYESPTISDDGTPFVAPNRNQATPGGVHVTELFVLPTITAVGTQLTGGLQPNKDGGSERDGAVWVLNESTDYLLRLTNISGGKRDMELEFQFFEDDLP